MKRPLKYIFKVLIPTFLVLLGTVPGCISQSPVANEIRANRYVRAKVLLNDSDGEDVQQIEKVSGVLSLEDCVELTLRHSPEVQQAKLKLLEARGQTIEATATALPSASFAGSALRHDNSGLIQQKETYDLQLLVRQPLYLGGLIGVALDAAQSFSYQKQQELRQTIQTVQFQLRKTYIDVLLAKRLVEVSLEDRRNATKLLSDSQKKLRFGSATRYEVLRAQVRLNAIEAELISRQNTAQISLKRLLNVMGVSQTSQVELSGKLDYKAINIDDRLCQLTALQQRPDLLIEEALVRLARDNVVSEQAGNRPKVYLQGIYQRSYPGFGADFGSSDSGSDGDGSFGVASFRKKQWERTMSGGIVVEWPFFNGFATLGRVIKAKALLQETQISLLNLEQQSQLEVIEALLTLENSDKFIQSQIGNVSDAQEALRLAQVGFREGAVSSLDVIASENALAQAQSNYYEAVHVYQLSKLNLSLAIGIIGEEDISVVSVSKNNDALDEDSDEINNEIVEPSQDEESDK